MDTPSLTEAVRREMLALPDVTEAPHRFGGIVFRVGGQEIGHLHGERVADLPFPSHIRDELVASGRATADRHGSDSAFVSRGVESPDDVAAIVELFRMSYEHAAAEAARAAEQEAREAAAAAAAAEQRAGWRGVFGLRRGRRR